MTSILAIPVLGRLLAVTAAMVVVFGMFSHAGTGAEADTSVGNMEHVQQTVYGTPPNGQQLAKHAGDGVVFQESIETWEDSGARLRFIDGSRLTLGPKAKVLIDEFVFDPAETQGNALIKISAGTLRWITGMMPKGQTVIKTPTATLTLRGTDVTVRVHPDGTTDTTVHDGSVDNHNELTKTDTTMGPGDSQTSDGTGNHTNSGDDAGDLGNLGNPGGSNGDTPERRRGEVPQTEPDFTSSSHQQQEPPPCDCR